MNILNSAPPEAWFVLFGVIIGSAISQLGVLLTNRASARLLRMQLDYQREEKERDQARQRLEQLYVECRKYFNDLGAYYLPYRRVMEGDMTFNQALDMTIEHGKAEGYDPAHVPMLIDFYFPVFKDDFQEIMALRDRLNKIMHGFREQYRTGDTDGTRWIALFQPVLESFAKKMEAFEERVARHGPDN